MRDAVICSPLRTPVGRFGGVFRELSAADLATRVIEALLDGTGLPATRVDDVILGQCYPSGEAPAVGRVAALDAGLPTDTPGWQLDRRCGSGLTAVITAAMQVQTGASDVVLAGGTESMSQAEHYAVGLRWGGHRTVELEDRLARARVTAGGKHFPVPGGMVETAENVRRAFGISRADQDALAVRSHRRAVVAHDEGRFAEELVPVVFADRNQPADAMTVDRDEHPRPEASDEALGRLRPVLRKRDPQATVTAGNSSGQNDGAAICIVTTPDVADQLSLQPIVKLVGWGVAGVAPSLMGLGPVPATERALDRAGMRLADVDLIELNEAFAVQVLAVAQEWGLGDVDHDRLNVNGSGISLGHPAGATGARILATLAYEMQRRGSRFGLETMCIGGGQGMAAIFERVDV